jgi:hypothetical protein
MEYFLHLLESWKDEIINGRVALPKGIRGGKVMTEHELD